MNLDRRDIAPLLREHFPSIPDDATSDDWHGFLNAQTNLDVPADEDNASAFDKWRQALAATGLPVWGVDEARIKDIAARGARLLALEAARVAAEAATLAQLAVEAPQVSAQQLMDAAKP